jgi:hypothetical protein
MMLIIAFLICLGVIMSSEQATDELIHQYESQIVIEDMGTV